MGKGEHLKRIYKRYGAMFMNKRQMKAIKSCFGDKKELTKVESNKCTNCQFRKKCLKEIKEILNKETPKRYNLSKNKKKTKIEAINPPNQPFYKRSQPKIIDKLKRCKECNKILRKNNKSGLCNYHNTLKKKNEKRKHFCFICKKYSNKIMIMKFGKVERSFCTRHFNKLSQPWINTEKLLRKEILRLKNLSLEN